MSSASIDPSAKLGKGVTLGQNVVVGRNVRIGKGTVVGNGCVIHDATIIGKQVTVFDNTVLGRRPQGVGSMTRRPKKSLPPLRIGDGCVIGACAVLYRGTSIGRETLIGDLASIREECEIGSHTIIARGVTVNYHTRIGNHVKIMDNTHITGNMVIEDRVFISALVSTTNDKTMDRCGHGDAGFGGPVIEQGASIASSVAILPGVRVGAYSLVASGTVVNRNVPACKVIAGAPPRVVGSVPKEWLRGAGRKSR